MLPRSLPAVLFLITTAVQAATFTVTNKDHTGPGTLRDAMLNAEAAPGSTINFAIAGSPPFVIALNDPFLPAMTVPVTIDATTQPGYAGTPVVEVTIQTCNWSGDPALCSLTPPIFDLRGGSSTLRGFKIDPRGYFVRPLELRGSHNVIERNVLAFSDNRNRFVPAARLENNTGTMFIGNVVTSTHTGLLLLGGGNNVVQQNTITASVNALWIDASNANNIGGSLSQGNTFDGGEIEFLGGYAMRITGSGNLVQGNRSSSRYAISVGGSDNQIGGATGNILQNAYRGVVVTGTGNGIHRNVIYPLFDASSIAITPTSGAPAPPTITRANVTATTTVVEGTLNGAAGNYVLEFFASPTCAPPAAQRFLGAYAVAVPASGSATFTATLPNGGTAGDFINATVTSAQEDTSALSSCVAANAQPCAAPQITTQPQDTAIVAGQSATLAVAATGSGLSYQWYESATPIFGESSSTLTVSPATTTSYWVRVTSGCGASVDSAVAQVRVEPACQRPVITVQPGDRAVTSGQSVVLAIATSGTGGVVTWYRGAPPDTSQPIGTGATISTGPLTSTTIFWARVVNDCGDAATRAVRITVTGTRRRTVPH